MYLKIANSVLWFYKCSLWIVPGCLHSKESQSLRYAFQSSVITQYREDWLLRTTVFITCIESFSGPDITSFVYYALKKLQLKDSSWVSAVKSSCVPIKSMKWPDSIYIIISFSFLENVGIQFHFYASVVNYITYLSESILHRFFKR